MYSNVVWLNFEWNDALEILDAIFFSVIDNTELEYLDVLGAYCLDANIG